MYNTQGLWSFKCNVHQTLYIFSQYFTQIVLSISETWSNERTHPLYYSVPEFAAVFPIKNVTERDAGTVAEQHVMCSRVQLDRQEHGCSSRSRRKLWMIYEVKFTETFQGEFNLKRWICFKFHCINKLPIWIGRPEAVKDALRILYHSEFSIIPHCKNYASTTIIFCAKYSWLLWATKAIAIHSYVCFDICGSPAHGQRMLSSATSLFSSKFSSAPSFDTSVAHQLTDSGRFPSQLVCSAPSSSL